jgi:hypothetical protein
MKLHDPSLRRLARLSAEIAFGRVHLADPWIFFVTNSCSPVPPMSVMLRTRRRVGSCRVRSVKIEGLAPLRRQTIFPNRGTANPEDAAFWASPSDLSDRRCVAKADVQWEILTSW